ncbi:MAG: MFS transporter [Myxococcales bacterium]
MFKLALLASLYLSQGLPFGFFTQFLPVLLRQEGVSLAWIGPSSLLAAPWGFKFLWAPYVDRHGSERFGRRRSWIVPLQAASTMLLLALSLLDEDGGWAWLLVGVFCANLLTATQDIATDALAVELLPEDERGLGNGVQVAGFRVGMIVGGGLMLWVLGEFGRSVTFIAMACLLALCSLPIYFYREAPRAPVPSRAARSPLAELWYRLRHPRLGGWLVVLALYKAGDAFGSAMLRPLLVDRGGTLADIGRQVGVVGALAGLTGALVGGALLRVLPRALAVGSFGALHGLSLLLYGVHGAVGLAPLALYGGLALEHFLGGMATVALFTCMMDRCDPETAGTDYTLQASLSVGAGGVIGMGSGLSAEWLGYPVHFALAALLAIFGAGVGYRFLARA